MSSDITENKKGKLTLRKNKNQDDTASDGKVAQSGQMESQGNNRVPELERPMYDYSTQSPPAVAALPNLGNTCYINSILQVLRYTPGFKELIENLYQELKTTYQDLTGHRNCPYEDLPGSCQIVKGLDRTFYAMDRAEENYESGYRYNANVRPYDFLECVRAANSTFGSGNQEDAHEFFSDLLHHIQETVTEVNKQRGKLRARLSRDLQRHRINLKRPLSEWASNGFEQDSVWDHEAASTSCGVEEYMLSARYGSDYQSVGVVSGSDYQRVGVVSGDGIEDEDTCEDYDDHDILEAKRRKMEALGFTESDNYCSLDMHCESYEDAPFCCTPLPPEVQLDGPVESSPATRSSLRIKNRVSSSPAPFTNLTTKHSLNRDSPSKAKDVVVNGTSKRLKLSKLSNVNGHNGREVEAENCDGSGSEKENLDEVSLDIPKMNGASMPGEDVSNKTNKLLSDSQRAVINGDAMNGNGMTHASNGLGEGHSSEHQDVDELLTNANGVPNHTCTNGNTGSDTVEKKIVKTPLEKKQGVRRPGLTCLSTFKPNNGLSPVKEKSSAFIPHNDVEAGLGLDDEVNLLPTLPQEITDAKQVNSMKTSEKSLKLNGTSSTKDYSWLNGNGLQTNGHHGIASDKKYSGHKPLSAIPSHVRAGVFSDGLPKLHESERTYTKRNRLGPYPKPKLLPHPKLLVLPEKQPEQKGLSFPSEDEPQSSVSIKSTVRSQATGNSHVKEESGNKKATTEGESQLKVQPKQALLFTYFEKSGVSSKVTRAEVHQQKLLPPSPEPSVSTNLTEGKTGGKSVDKTGGKSVDKTKGKSVDKTGGKSVDKMKGKTEGKSVDRNIFQVDFSSPATTVCGETFPITVESPRRVAKAKKSFKPRLDQKQEKLDVDKQEKSCNSQDHNVNGALADNLCPMVARVKVTSLSEEVLEEVLPWRRHGGRPWCMTPVRDVVAEMFQGEMGLRTRCCECENFSQIKEHFMDLKVPVRKSSHDSSHLSSGSISDEEDNEDPDHAWIFDALQEVERLKDDNKYKCDTCSRANEAERSTHYLTIPQILVIQVKRFSYCFKAGKFLKINDLAPTPFEFPCFEDACKKKCSHSFELYGIVAHAGSSISQGHYIAYVKHGEFPFPDYQGCSDPPEASGSLDFDAVPGLADDASDPNNNADPNNNVEDQGGLYPNIGVTTSEFGVVNDEGRYGGDDMEFYKFSERWLECDDHVVVEMSREDMLKKLNATDEDSAFRATPYMLFYSRRG